MRHYTRAIALAAAACMLAPNAALAWGAKGHTMINYLAAQALPANMPDFIRTAQAAREIGTLGPEEDRLKGAGRSWDADNDPGHFLDIGDDGTVDGVPLNAFPDSMSEYAIALEAAHTTPWRVGYLPYSIEDGFEQLREDFAYWRVDAYAAQHVSDPALRARFAYDEELRETLTVRDLGIWGHFVGDACQPLHITIHFNGWGNYPNPQHFTQAHIHSLFESTTVDRYVTASMVTADVAAPPTAQPDHLLSQAEIMALTATYLQGSAAAVIPLYQIEQHQGFDNGSPDAVAFTAKQLARGVAELRDLSELAWTNSLYGEVGYPSESVRDILSGKVPVMASLLGTV